MNDQDDDQVEDLEAVKLSARQMVERDHQRTMQRGEDRLRELMNRKKWFV